MKVNQSECVEYLANDGCWEMTICMETAEDKFKVLCLDGQVREFTDADENIKWRFVV
jgi:hypothetical protein